MSPLLTKIVSGFALFCLVILIALLYEGVDRIVHARMQRRFGPPLLQPFYDVIKLLGKESIVPRRAVRAVFQASPWMAMALTLLIFLYIPIGSIPPILAGNGDIILILYLLAASAVMMVIGGFASGSPYANVGSQREMVLMMSYELPLALVVLTLAWLVYKRGVPGAPFSLETFVSVPVWNTVGLIGGMGIFALLLSLLGVVPAEVGKVPMDIAEAKTEILEGFLAEYSGRNLALFKLTFALRSLAMSALLVPLFFLFAGQVVWLKRSIIRAGRFYLVLGKGVSGSDCGHYCSQNDVRKV
ncbi:MAG: complex I subunit 1 family protein [Acetomicrobium sp.]